MQPVHDVEVRAVLVENARWLRGYHAWLSDNLTAARGFDGTARASLQDRLDPTRLTYADFDKLRGGLIEIGRNLDELLIVPTEPEPRHERPRLQVIQGGLVT